MHRCLLVLVVTCAGCTEKGDAAGKVVVDWKSTGATSMTDVKLGKELAPRTVKDAEVVLIQDYVSGDIVFAVHAETAPTEVETTPSPKAVMPPAFDAPRAVSITLKSTGDWNVSGSCDDPSIDMPAIDSDGRFVYGRLVRERCTIKLHYKSFRNDLHGSLDLTVGGDGEIKTTSLLGKAVVR